MKTHFEDIVMDTMNFGFFLAALILLEVFAAMLLT